MSVRTQINLKISNADFQSKETNPTWKTIIGSTLNFDPQLISTVTSHESYNSLEA